MIFNDVIMELTTNTYNHASVFNAVNNQLLENTKFNKEKIDFYLGDIPINLFTSSWVVGTISSSSGEDRESTEAIRTQDYIPVEAETTYYVENNLGYGIYPYAYREDKTFIEQVGKYDNKVSFITPPQCAYLKFRTSTGNRENNPNVKFEMYKGFGKGGKINIGEQDLLSLLGGYELLVEYIDDDPNLPITTLKRKGGTGGEYTILELEAPRDNPKESTITLMRTNLPTGGAEFIDFTDMDYGKRKCCLVIQKRGNGAKLAPFDIGFNEGKGIVDKFRVFPDAMKVELKNNGIVLDGNLMPNQQQLARLEDKFNRTFSSVDGKDITVYSSNRRQISHGTIKGHSNSVYKINSNQVQFTKTGRRKSFDQITLEPGKQYTIIASCIGADEFPKSLLFYTPDANETSISFDFEQPGLKKHTFTVEEPTTIGIIFGSYSQFQSETNYLDFKEIVLLEGDYSNISDEEAQGLISLSSGQLGSTKAIVAVNDILYKVYSDVNKQQVVELRDDTNFYDELQYLTNGTVKISTTNKSNQQITTTIIPSSQVEIPYLNEGKNVISVGDGCLSKMFTFELLGDIDTKINVLSIDRGYKDSSVHGSGDMNTFTNNGKYYGKNLTNMPTGSWSVFDVTNSGGDWDVAQIVHATDQGISHIRYKNGNSWKVKQIATTDKTDILFTPKPSFTILNQKNSKINNILHINVEVGKTDGSMFTGGQFVNVVTLPFNVWNTTISMIGSYGGFFQIAGCGIAYETHLSVIPSKECQSIRISGVIVL